MTLSSTEPVPAAPAAARHILTFKPRRGRVSELQDDALRRLGPSWVLSIGDAAAWAARRSDGEPLVLEIGFGMGEATAAMALQRPEVEVLAVDVHTPGVGALLHRLERQGSTNVRVVHGDAVDVLAALPEGVLAGVRAFFPDPWPKARHHKRRLVRPDLMGLVAQRLRRGGVLHLATDWAPYAGSMLAVVADEPLLVNPYGGPAPRPLGRPVTRFEQQGLAKGHEVTDVVAFRRRQPAEEAAR